MQPLQFDVAPCLSISSAQMYSLRRTGSLILLRRTGNVNLWHLHHDVDCWHYSLLAVCTGRSPPRHSSNRTSMFCLCQRCSYALRGAVRVLNTPLSVPTTISPLTERYPQEHTVAPETIQFGHPDTHCGSPEVHLLTKLQANLDCFPRSRSNGVFPSRPTSYRLTTVSANSTNHANMLWLLGIWAPTRVLKASTRICPSTVCTPLSATPFEAGDPTSETS